MICATRRSCSSTRAPRRSSASSSRARRCCRGASRSPRPSDDWHAARVVPPRARRTEHAVAEAASLEAAKAAAGAREVRGTGGPGTADPLVAELRRAGLLRLLVLHFCAGGPCYGNQLMERIAE